MDYEAYLLRELYSDKYTFEIATEQMFVKDKNYDPKKVYILIKYLSSSIEFGAKTQPIQIIFLSDDNEVNEVRELIDNFVNTHNWIQFTEGSDLIKQQYSNAVVLSNFSEVKYGMRSVIYVTGTLYILENVLDIKNLTIDGISLSPINFNLVYQMSGNTQPIGSDYLATTVKSQATIQMSMMLPLVSNNVSTKIINILNGTTSGNSTFTVAFSLNNISLSYDVKLLNAQISTAPNKVPGLQIGFMR